MMDKILNTIDDIEYEVSFDTEAISHRYIVSWKKDTISLKINYTYHNDTVYELKFIHKNELIFEENYSLKDYCNLAIKILQAQKSCIKYGECEYSDNITKIIMEKVE